MSKSLGNSPDPLDLIKTYGADGVRTGMLFSSPAGNDLLFDEKLCEQGRNFSNKIWNAFRLTKGWEVVKMEQPQENKIAIEWFEAKMNQSLIELEDHYSKFRISDALHTTYKLVWDDFCAWYLEIVKPEFGKPIDETTYHKTISYFENLLKILHPFMPFITEELWHELNERKEKECIIVEAWPKAGAIHEVITKDALVAFEVVAQVRNIRNAKGISPKEALKLIGKVASKKQIDSFGVVIKKIANLSELSFVNDKVVNATNFLVGTLEFYIPMEGMIDAAKERESILKEIEYQKGFIEVLDKKLLNEKFIASAKPEVVALERKKKADAEAKIKLLEESLRQGNRF